MTDWKLRPAQARDISAMHRIRLAVRENALSDASRIGEKDYAAFLEDRGRSWVVEADGQVIGFAALDVGDASIWALFVAPGAEGQGVGRALLDVLEHYARELGLVRLRLSTAPRTRAESFYERRAWQRCGLNDAGEVLFELHLERPVHATGVS